MIKTKKELHKTNSGFIALISAVIVSVVLLLIATNLGLSGFYDRSNILDFELKGISLNLAEACVDTVLLKIANNPNYIASGGETISLSGQNVCTIDQSISSSPNRTFITRANYKNTYFTKLQVVVNIQNNISIVSLEEI